jgi:probable addiction module antidote protein
MPKAERTSARKADFTPYDIAEHLRTPEEMAAYLDAWREEAPDDPAGIARAKGMTQVAKDAGLSRESLYRALSADGNPSFATVVKVTKALGMQLHAQAIPQVAEHS